MTRYRSAWILLVCIVLLTGVSHKTFAQGTAFTYQGRLQDGGTNANGSYDFQFTLWDALTGGTQQPQPTPITVTRSNVTVVSGIFTVQLDFGATTFPGADRFLETGARLTGPGVFTILSPRQQITSTPYAIRSTSAGSADTAHNADQLGGIAANNYLQTVTHNLSLFGTGASNAALGVAVPLQLSGNFVGQGIISGINTNSAGAGVYGRSNLTNSGGEFSAGVYGENIGGGNGVYGVSNSNNDGFGGVFGQATNGDGVIGSGGRSGVFGFSTAGNGVTGNSGSTSFAGVSGFNGNTGFGVWGFADNGRAIYGLSANAFAGYFEGKSYFSSNVGIGTTAPGVLLEVRRNGTMASDWQTGQLRISGASDPNRQLNLGYDTSSNLGVIQAGQANIGFRTLSINPFGGSVGIGTISPDQELSVNGNASKSGGGSWLTFSDERLKNITGHFSSGLKAVMQLQPLRYEYRRDNALNLASDGEHVGFSAQAVQKVIPEAVTRNEEGYLLVNNDPIMWSMLNAIKEQQEEIQQQRNQIKKQNEQAIQARALFAAQQQQIRLQKEQAAEQQAMFAAQQRQIDALKILICRSHRRATACK
ncbi:MAG TPA: tail fiber domain-containing protein [Pyrinomonadaceae bacterium]|nr:tail fiber domain-containing protein [Pyrinomonadaceae bacterium]